MCIRLEIGDTEMTDAVTDGWAMMKRVERAFNAGDVDALMEDYADDAVMELEIAGKSIIIEGRDAIRASLARSVASSPHTTVKRVAASGNTLAAQIVGDDGRTLIASYWDMRDGKIIRDVGIIAAPELFAPKK